MRLGSGPLQQPGEDAGFARLYFLQTANALEPRTLQELHQQIYPVYARGDDFKPMLRSWCQKWNLLFQGEPAEWVVGRVDWTLPWWKNGKPTPEQLARAQGGGRPIHPLEWCPMRFRLGIPM